jgi:hypothetical protein
MLLKQVTPQAGRLDSPGTAVPVVVVTEEVFETTVVVVVDVDVGDEDFEVEEDEVFDTEKVGSVEKILIGVVDVDLVEEVLLVVDDDEVEV